MAVTSTDGPRIRKRVHARIGLLGNPSDGYFGKTIALSLGNFHADVELTPAASGIYLKPHPVFDGTTFESLRALADKASGEGFYGGLRLLMATCSRFFEVCTQKGIVLESKGFSLEYDTTIPRQAGLSGSSALITAALNCLMEYYGVEEDIPVVERPGLALSIESSLGITAGLQDRVIQVYGGLVMMDFDRKQMEERGHGRYSAMDPGLLPRLHIMYAQCPSDSGKVHSDVKKRWLNGDKEVQGAMEELAGIVDAGRAAIEDGNEEELGALMNRNFDIRRRLFGDAALGAINIEMIDTARAVGAAAKFTGSGGAIVVLCKDEDQANRLGGLCKARGFILEEVVVGPSLHRPAAVDTQEGAAAGASASNGDGGDDPNAMDRGSWPEGATLPQGYCPLGV